MTAPEPPAGLEASDLGRFEPAAYDLGITDDPEPQSPSQAELWAAQNAPRIADGAGLSDAEYERLLSDRQQAEAAYLARWGSLAPEPRSEAELAAAARAEAWGPQSPVPYLLTPAAEAELESSHEIGLCAAADDPKILAAFSSADEAYGRAPGTAARLLAGTEITDQEAAFEAAAEVLDEWDPEAAAAYMDRVEAGLEPEADDPEAGEYPSFDDDPAKWGLLPPEPMAEAELATAAEAEAWGPRGPSASYAEWLAEGEPEAEP